MWWSSGVGLRDWLQGGRASDYLLGSSLGASYKLEAACKGKEERFRKRLSTWKRQYISNMESYFFLISKDTEKKIY